MFKANNFSLLWAVALSFAIGIAIGTISSSGFHIDRDESAKFVGSMLGSIIAVSGAVSLYYLKERNDISKKRRHLDALIKVAIQFAPLATKDILANNHPLDAMLTFKGQYDRCVAYADKYQFDDYAISEAFDCIFLNSLDLLEKRLEAANDESARALASEIITTSQKALKRAHEALWDADKKLEILR